ncbi:D-2-hydroxyacid dehydrogenase [Lentilactobacillus diolivorans]|uniref:D-lactate dehydrogenase n=2 Tax=Lentilactobacillus diolivorans TaxID=179838 RepID=A0A0R1SID2_9LACO|nr:D-2-hydroxyacid dehydrogenase [Lentilactobacillus diolivorans]KRL68928.1 D-lactate dehydrogenase [Lentilactobacillus diolivorans DSM 14421]MDH5104432.1 D-2-hydroxyacid dehydrogenase [Lentilactobacillus diolivorans]RRG04563.1 MAG: D-2-hydroxyacid dehydrogenase [Lactobacillus sp.]GEP22627.1 D-lactate dehydrogenase [Lentilactobacillus diolivorans]
MKIIAYGIRDDEKPYLDKWSEENSDVEVESTGKLLDESTVDQAKGADGVVTYQQKPYTAAVLDKLGSFGIKFLSLRNVGVDNVDADAAKRNNIQVTNVPAYSPQAIAEFTVTELMRLLRRTPTFDRKQANGDLRWAPDIADELNQMTVGVFATGRIGRAAIQIYKGFGAKVIAYDIFHNPELEKEGIYVDSPDELYAKSDVLSIHAPATKENEHMLNDDAFSKMKDGVYILNPARGTLVDTDALIRALDSGKVAGAALDVYEDEVGIFNTDFGSFDKIPDERLKNLMKRENVLVTPHIAFYTKRAVRNMVYFAMDANKSLIQTGKSDKLVKL